MLLGIKCWQVDDTLAFPQAEFSDPVYIHIPQCWFISDDGTLQPHLNPKHDDNYCVTFTAVNKLLGAGSSLSITTKGLKIFVSQPSTLVYTCIIIV
jgi:hypothetical protein